MLGMEVVYELSEGWKLAGGVVETHTGLKF